MGKYRRHCAKLGIAVAAKLLNLIPAQATCSLTHVYRTLALARV